MKIIFRPFIAVLSFGLFTAPVAQAQSNQKSNLNHHIMENQTIHYRNIKVNGLHLFYRESGSASAPTILLLHGYPTSSHMFRNLIPILSKKYHVIAPDLPGFGYSDAPDHKEFAYTFDHLARTVQAFTEQLKMKRFAIYIFDYGAPVGLRVAMNNPEKITGIISQNGNAYEEGLSNEWNPIQKYWRDPSEANRLSLKDFVSREATYFQYHHGVSDPSLIAPETYTLDQKFLDRPGNIEIQLDLVKDYRTNVALYPKFHEYFRKYQPKLLLVWGNKDPYFLPQGAEAYQKDLPAARLKFYDTGHFALETNADEIGTEILEFMGTLPK
ncbi:alpha/beta hydrolase [Chryseobacterium sp.]|uniref:alpha/beta fold hydrolase n=1 Tax=Chryseobacterium sp. TaxID=1871047 RepID=UPI0025BC94BD|nr:alpha/beta hydrolase [Chryseobacterium sp.]MBV8325147.1 alpha/beta hydrolase [Chryseobacterium sp.]